MTTIILWLSPVIEPLPKIDESRAPRVGCIGLFGRDAALPRRGARDARGARAAMPRHASTHDDHFTEFYPLKTLKQFGHQWLQHRVCALSRLKDNDG